MTRLFGCVCNQPKAFGAAIEPVRSALKLPGPVGRWGVGYVQWGEVCLKLSPRGSDAGIDFYEPLSSVPTDYVIGSVSPNDGRKGNANTAPFRFRQWLAAQEGTLPADTDLAPLKQHIPEFLQRNIRGQTPAEHVFHLFLGRLHTTGQLGDPNLPVEASAAALRDVWGLLVDTFGDAAKNLGNLIYTNGRSMFGVRISGPLYLCPLQQTIDPKRPESELRAAVLVSSDQPPADSFEEVPVGHVVAIRRDVSTDLLPFTEAPSSDAPA